jgi:hypothetical protein
VSSAVIGSATCAEKPGWVLAMSFVASSCETACLVRSRARSRSRNSRISASTSMSRGGGTLRRPRTRRRSRERAGGHAIAKVRRGGIGRKVPVVTGDVVGIGHRMKVTMSSDRVVDGAMAAQFLAEVRRLLENPVSLLV